MNLKSFFLRGPQQPTQIAMPLSGVESGRRMAEPEAVRHRVDEIRQETKSSLWSVLKKGYTAVSALPGKVVNFVRDTYQNYFGEKEQSQTPQVKPVSAYDACLNALLFGDIDLEELVASADYTVAEPVLLNNREVLSAMYGVAAYDAAVAEVVFEKVPSTQEDLLSGALSFVDVSDHMFRAQFLKEHCQSFFTTKSVIINQDVMQAVFDTLPSLEPGEGFQLFTAAKKALRTYPVDSTQRNALVYFLAKHGCTYSYTLGLLTDVLESFSVPDIIHFYASTDNETQIRLCDLAVVSAPEDSARFLANKAEFVFNFANVEFTHRFLEQSGKALLDAAPYYVARIAAHYLTCCINHKDSISYLYATAVEALGVTHAQSVFKHMLIALVPGVYEFEIGQLLRHDFELTEDLLTALPELRTYVDIVTDSDLFYFSEFGEFPKRFTNTFYDRQLFAFRATTPSALQTGTSSNSTHV